MSYILNASQGVSGVFFFFLISKKNLLKKDRKSVVSGNIIDLVVFRDNIKII